YPHPHTLPRPLHDALPILRNDRPAILDSDLRGIVGHRAEAVSDHVEEMSDRRVSKPILMKRRRAPVAAPHDHAVTLAGRAARLRSEEYTSELQSPYDLVCR